MMIYFFQVVFILAVAAIVDIVITRLGFGRWPWSD
jgi:hypothetical protein